MNAGSAFILGVLMSGCASVAEVGNSNGSSSRPALAPATDTTADAAEQIRTFFRDYFQAVEAGEPAGILALVDEDFVLKWPLGEPITDRERLRAALASFKQAFRQDVQWEVVEVHVEGKWAWARVNEKAQHFPHGGGDTRTLEGSHLAILRNDGRRWLLHRDYASLNQLPQNR